MILNFIKYLAFGVCILYVLNQNRDMMHYLEKGSMIGGGMVVVEYIIENICRDVREKFTTGPGIKADPKENNEDSDDDDDDDDDNRVIKKGKEDKVIKKLVKESKSQEKNEKKTKLDKDDLESSDEESDDSDKEEGDEEDGPAKKVMKKEPKQKIEYGYSFVHPDAMKLPEIRIPKCIGDKACSVCPVMMGGTADLMQIEPRKKPIAGCQ